MPRSCKFYSPGEGLQVRWKGKLAEATDYPFDRLFHYGSCFNCAIVGIDGFGRCGSEADQSQCPGFEEEATVVLDSRVVSRHDARTPNERQERINLERGRVEIGWPVYYITSAQLAHPEDGEFGEPVLVHTVSVKSDPEAETVAPQLFEMEVEERQRYEVTQVPPPKKNVVSFLRGLTGAKS